MISRVAVKYDALECSFFLDVTLCSLLTKNNAIRSTSIVFFSNLDLLLAWKLMLHISCVDSLVAFLAQLISL